MKYMMLSTFDSYGGKYTTMEWQIKTRASDTIKNVADEK